MKLSILICHLEDRNEKWALLRDTLMEQVIQVPCHVELIVETDNGEMTVGQKRNVLLEKAGGDYICFVDDDDMVPDCYVGEILKATCREGMGDPSFSYDVPPGKLCDVVGIKGHYTVGEGQPQVFIHSIRYREWFSKDGVHYRCPNHLNPVKRELALKAGFTDKNFGEDQDYSMALLPLLKTEVFVDKVMYYYRK